MAAITSELATRNWIKKVYQKVKDLFYSRWKYDDDTSGEYVKVTFNSSEISDFDISIKGFGTSGESGAILSEIFFSGEYYKISNINNITVDAIYVPNSNDSDNYDIILKVSRSLSSIQVKAISISTFNKSVLHDATIVYNPDLTNYTSVSDVEIINATVPDLALLEIKTDEDEYMSYDGTNSVLIDSVYESWIADHFSSEKVISITQGDHTVSVTTDFSDDVNIELPSPTEYDVATEDNVGLIKLGSDTLADPDDESYRPVQLDEDNKAYVYVPTSDTYELPAATEDNLGGILIGHDATETLRPVLLDDNNRAYVEIEGLNGDYVPQVSTLDNSWAVGTIVLYDGETSGSYINGYFYKLKYSYFTISKISSAESVYNVNENTTVSKIQTWNRLNPNKIISIPGTFTLSLDEDTDEIVVTSGNVSFSLDLTTFESTFDISINDNGLSWDATYLISPTGTSTHWERIDVLPNLGLLHYILAKAEYDNIPDAAGGTLTAANADPFGIYLVETTTISNDTVYREYIVDPNPNSNDGWGILGDLTSVPGTAYTAGNNINISPSTHTISLEDNIKINTLNTKIMFVTPSLAGTYPLEDEFYSHWFFNTSYDLGLDFSYIGNSDVAIGHSRTWSIIVKNEGSSPINISFVSSNNNRRYILDQSVLQIDPDFIGEYVVTAYNNPYDSLILILVNGGIYST